MHFLLVVYWWCQPDIISTVKTVSIAKKRIILNGHNSLHLSALRVKTGKKKDMLSLMRQDYSAGQIRLVLLY